MARLASLKDFLAMASSVRFYATASFEGWLWAPSKPMAGHSMWKLGQTIRDLFQLETPACEHASMSHRQSLKLKRIPPIKGNLPTSSGATRMTIQQTPSAAMHLQVALR